MATGDELLEAVSADTISHELKRAAKHSLPLGAPCLNCHTPLTGPWCAACGQRGEKYSRSIWRLTTEAIEGLTDLDGRLWQTVPRLILRPGRLTRDYLDGHRAVQVSPFRIFLLVLLLVFFAGGESLNHDTQAANQDARPGAPNAPAASTHGNKAGFRYALTQFRDVKDTDINGVGLETPAARAYWAGKLRKAAANPDAFIASASEWAHRLAVVMLPIAALMLSALFLFKKNVYVFDHLIFSMHSLSFQGLLLSAGFAGATASAAAWNVLWVAPVHLFFHMRGTYRTSVVGTLLRMLVLFFASAVQFGVMILAMVMLGLATFQ
ncbi:DUF3667 domain-containing protein [Phenylobacterium sp.]|uniref:DUF3667 domain-containing protein n=1 Tax=Phenylobacterium sp. TaxID=1871053 RepID=UPI001228E3EF|nr:DUF3667 domain-containing protein [Phenylobacterium sp.]THD63460.1 MAG: DUF3667 domain-containing protein [Phenylobacterium sp.]